MRVMLSDIIVLRLLRLIIFTVLPFLEYLQVCMDIPRRMQPRLRLRL